MARTLAEAYVRAKLDTTGIGAEAEKAGKTAGGKLHSGVMSSTKGIAAGLATAFATVGAIEFFKGMNAEAKESVRVGALTAAAIKSTGGAAHITAQQVSDLAGALSNKAGVDDELIQSGANLMLTFTGVRNAAGKGNDVFNQATKATLDMTAAMNGGVVTQDGLKASTIQVGKALNDPIKGLTALSRVGVTFTEQQKAQITAMVAAGDTMGAQKVILAELSKEFGGAAEAAASPAQKASVAWGNLQEMLGLKVMPVLTKLLNWGLAQQGWLIPTVAVLASLAAVFWAVTLATKAWEAAQVIAKVATTAWTGAQWLLNIAMDANPIGLLIVGIAALVAAVVFAWFHFEGFRKVVIATWEGIAAGATWLWNTVLKPWFAILGAELRIAGDVFMWLWHHVIQPWWGGVKLEFEVGRAALARVFDAIGTAIDRVRDVFRIAVDGIRTAWAGLKEAAAAPVRFVVNTVLNEGIIKGWNWINSNLHVGSHVNPIGIPFAGGGVAPGRDTGRDYVPALLRGGEGVLVPEVVAQLGPRTILDWNAAASGGRRIQNFALGGIVDWILHPVDSAKKLFGAGLDGLARFEGNPFGKMIGDVGRSLVSMAIDKAKDLIGSLFGGGGPTGAGPGFLPWPSSPAAQRGDSGVWRSIVALINSTGPLSGSFGNAYRPGDPLWHGSGRAVDWMGFNQDALASFFMARLGSVLEMIHRTNTRDYAVTRGRNMGSFNQALMEAHRNHLHIAMDGGGVLLPGWNPPIYNGTGRPEPVTPAATMEAVVARLDALAGWLAAVVAAIERVAPGVGAEINGAGRRTVQTLRAR